MRCLWSHCYICKLIERIFFCPWYLLTMILIFSSLVHPVNLYLEVYAGILLMFFNAFFLTVSYCSWLLCLFFVLWLFAAFAADNKEEAIILKKKFKKECSPLGWRHRKKYYHLSYVLSVISVSWPFSLFILCTRFQIDNTESKQLSLLEALATHSSQIFTVTMLNH